MNGWMIVYKRSDGSLRGYNMHTGHGPGTLFPLGSWRDMPGSVTIWVVAS